jgi:hypothetical protein
MDLRAVSFHMLVFVVGLAQLEKPRPDTWPTVETPLLQTPWFILVPISQVNDDIQCFLWVLFQYIIGNPHSLTSWKYVLTGDWDDAIHTCIFTIGTQLVNVVSRHQKVSEVRDPAVHIYFWMKLLQY